MVRGSPVYFYRADRSCQGGILCVAANEVFEYLSPLVANHSAQSAVLCKSLRQRTRNETEFDCDPTMIPSDR